LIKQKSDELLYICDMGRKEQKPSTMVDYLYIDSPETFQQFIEENQGISWMGFDTEFVGEKRFYTLLCLIQVITDNGIYIIDSIEYKNLGAFYEMVADPNIVKITHAGENDYRLLKIQGNVVPKSLFDTQIAAGFVGYNYPISFRKLVASELNINLGKGYTVSDWQSRPINKKQIKYALDDIIYLKQLWELLTNKLNEVGRYDWAIEEMKKYEIEEYYQAVPHKEAFSNSMIYNLRPKNQLFLIRLYKWRREMAERKNYSKEMILPGKYISPITRNIGSGRAALKNHRRLPNGIMGKYMDEFLGLYEADVTPEEEAVLAAIPAAEIRPTGQETIMEMLSLLIKIKCNQERLSNSLLIYGSGIKKMKADDQYFDEKLATGWRGKFLGEDLITWLRNRKDLIIEMQENQCVIKMA